MVLNLNLKWIATVVSCDINFKKMATIVNHLLKLRERVSINI